MNETDLVVIKKLGDAGLMTQAYAAMFLPFDQWASMKRLTIQGVVLFDYVRRIYVLSNAGRALYTMASQNA